MIGVKSSGSFDNILGFLKRNQTGQAYSALDSYGRLGVEALSAATPVDTDETAHSWGYRIIDTPSKKGIEWYNTHEVDGVNIAVIRQYGHGTGTGGYVEGLDYINPAMQAVFDIIIAGIWKEVIR